MVNEMEIMNWQFIKILGLAVFAVLSFATFISNSNMRGVYSAAWKASRLRSARARARSVTEVSRCGWGVMHMAAVVARNDVYLALVEGTKFEEAKYG